MYTELLKNICKALYNPDIEVTKTVQQFFRTDYQQCINGISMNRVEYINHVIEQRKNMKIETIEYKHILEKGNEVFAIYYPKGKNMYHKSIEVEVIAYFCFLDNQIKNIHGLVRLIKGDFNDIDMKN